MKREIIFRGMRVHDGIWVYGDLLQPHQGNDETFIAHNNGHIHKVKPESVGQYSGMNDSHGVKIFEHDLLELEYFDHDRQVEFISSMFQVHTIPLIKYALSYRAVRGNIHQP